MKLLRRALRYVMIPTVGGNWYYWSLIALGHTMLGQLVGSAIYFAGPTALLGALLQVFSVLVYYKFKEKADLRAGGSRVDSLVDTTFFTVGTFFGAYWVPLVSFLMVTVGSVLMMMKDEKDDI